VDWQFRFLGYQTSIGELIAIAVLTLLATLVVALIIEPLRRWISRTWDFLRDRWSSLSDSRTASQIRALERKIEQLNEYTDRKALLLFLRLILNLLVLFPFLIILNEFNIRLESSVHIRRITEFFNIPNPELFGYSTNEPWPVV
jgi:hypothetical protein